jgi:DNA-binding PadR family transcriptional regulator
MVLENEFDMKEQEEDEEMPDLRSSDLEVLRHLRYDGGEVAFQGLRRQMRMHQERLSRALQRLETDDLVRKTGRGYALTEKGSSLAQRWPGPGFGTQTVVMRSYLPGEDSPAAIAAHLEGKWFGGLRWLGIRETGDGVVLRWLAGGDIEVLLRLEWGRATIETNARDPQGMTEAFRAAQLIFGQIDGPWCQDWTGHNGTST